MTCLQAGARSVSDARVVRPSVRAVGLTAPSAATFPS